MNWKILFLAYSALFCFGLTDNSRGPVYPFILKEFAIRPELGSWFFALSSLTGFICNLTAYWWLKKFSVAKWTKIGLVILSFGPLFLAFASMTQNISLIWISSILQGLGMGFVGIGMNILVIEGTTVEYRRRAFGGLHALYGISSLVAPQIFSLWYNQQGHWSGLFIILSLPTLIVSLMTKSPTDIHKTPPPPTAALKLSKTTCMTWAIMVGLYVSSEIVISSRLIYYLQNAKNLSTESANYYLSGFFFLLMSGRLALGLFNFKISSKSLMKLSLISTIVFLSLGHFNFYIAFCFAGLSMSIFFPTAMDLMGHQYPQKAQAMTSVIMSGVGFFLTLMHLGFGQLAERLGVEKAMALGPICTMGSLVILFFLPEPKKN